MATQTTVRSKRESVTIKAPRFERAVFIVEGEAPYCQARFSEKAMRQIKEAHELGQRSRKNRNKEARNFEEEYLQAMHVSTEGWPGIPATAFRSALISACRLVGYKMTFAKLSIFVEPEGFDAVDHTPLIRIEGEPEMFIAPVRNATGVVDLRARPIWRKWRAKVTLRWDADQFSIDDVCNLMERAGMQVGIGEGRPDSRDSNGIGWGVFRITELYRLEELPLSPLMVDDENGESEVKTS